MDLWCDQRLIVRVNGPNGCQQVATCGPFARVGSHPDSEVVLPGTAKRALYLHATAVGVYCLDLRDHADAKSEQSGRWVQPETSIAVEGYSLSASLESVTNCCDLPPSLLSRNLLSRPALAFRITCKGGPKAKYKIHRALTVVGRDTACGLNLSGTKVSSPHCVLYCDQGRIWCVDLLSNNGTLLHGQRCEVAEVQVGDRLTVGEFRLVRCGQTAAAAATAEGDRSLFSRVNADAATPGATEVESSALEASDPSTVQLSKGDTVNVKLSEQSPQERSKPKDDFTRIIARPGGSEAGSSVVPPNKDGGHSPHYNVGEAGSTVILPSACLEPMDGTSPLSRHAVDEAMAKLDASAGLSVEIRELTRRLAEQDKLLVSLGGTLEAEQERWRLERDCLRYELTTQGNVIGDLKRELAVARATLDRQVIKARESSPVASIRGEVRENEAVTRKALVAVARSSQPVAFVEGERHATEVVDVEYTRVSRGEDAEQRSGCDRADENAPPTEILGWFPSKGREPEDQRDDQVAERETIQNMESVHSTVVWQQFQQAIAGQNKSGVCEVSAGEQGQAIREEVAGGCQAADPLLKVANQASPALGSIPMVDRRNELSQFVNERLHELDRSRMKLSHLAGAGVALVLVVAGVFASWWLGAF